MEKAFDLSERMPVDQDRRVPPANTSDEETHSGICFSKNSLGRPPSLLG